MGESAGTKRKICTTSTPFFRAAVNPWRFFSFARFHSGHDADAVYRGNWRVRALGSVGLIAGLFAYIALRKH
jgi:hypothetical protein